MYRKILLAADGSEHSIRAAEHAAFLAKQTSNSSVYILCVIDQEASKAEVLHHWNEDLNEVRREKLKPVEQKLEGTGVSYEVGMIRGEPGPAIVDFANKNEFDLVVLGSRGLNMLQQFVLGSVSHKVAKRANCPVLIVK